MGKLAVVAIGGNSITRAGQRGTIPEQFDNSRETSRHIAEMIERGYDVVVTHGNGPQVGNILLRAELASTTLPPLPLDTCGADAQGGMGYMLQQVLGGVLLGRGIKKDVVTVLTQVLVDTDGSGLQDADQADRSVLLEGRGGEKARRTRVGRRRGREPRLAPRGAVPDAHRGSSSPVPSRRSSRRGAS